MIKIKFKSFYAPLMIIIAIIIMMISSIWFRTSHIISDLNESKLINTITLEIN